MTHIRFRIDFAPHAHLGPGKIELLEAIRDAGSLSQAARTLGMSYRRAWLLLASINADFRKAATRAARGGMGGGGVRLTPFGEGLISSYRALEAQIARLVMPELRRIARQVSAPKANTPRAPRALSRRER